MRNRIVVVLLFAVVLPCLAAGAFLGYWKACATSTTRDESSIPGQVCLSASPCREDPEAQPPSSMPARRKESVSPPPMDPERWGKIQEAFHATLVSKGSPELLKLLNEGKEESKSLPYEAPVVEIQAKPELLPSPSVVEPVSRASGAFGCPFYGFSQGWQSLAQGQRSDPAGKRSAVRRAPLWDDHGQPAAASCRRCQKSRAAAPAGRM